jgi:hypothetical protein
VDEDSAFQGRKASKVEHGHLKAFIGNKGSMCCQSPLTVGAALHGSEYVHEVPPYTPSLWADRLCQSDGFEDHQPLGCASFDQRCAWTESGPAWVLVDLEERGLSAFGSVSISLDYAVKRRVAMLMYLATLRIGGIQFRPIPKLASAQILRDVADTLPNEVPAEAKGPTFRSYASQRNMNMRVLRIEVGRRYPFEARTKIGLHL